MNYLLGYTFRSSNLDDSILENVLKLLLMSIKSCLPICRLMIDHLRPSVGEISGTGSII